MSDPTADTQTRWYDLGFALERARQNPSRDRLDGLVDRLMSFRRTGSATPRERDGADAFDALVGGGTAALGRQMLKAIPKQRDPTVMRVAKGAAAGAAATFVRELAGPLLEGSLELPELGEGLPGRLASGAARGALFAAVVDPRLPGPAALRGAIFAAVEYLLAPNGGVSRIAGGIAPWRIIPGADTVVSQLEAGEESIVDHLVFGLALALMLGEG